MNNCPIFSISQPPVKNQCPKNLPTQTCIYTCQGELRCNTETKENSAKPMHIPLDTNIPFYHQAIQNLELMD